MIRKAMLIPSMGYIVGLPIGLYVYRKPHGCETRKISDSDDAAELKLCILIVTIVVILATFLVQTFTDSIIFGALAEVLVFLISRAHNWYKLDAKFVEGIKIMAYIGVAILTANGSVGVMNATGNIDELAKTLASITGGNKLSSIIMMYAIGLIVILGIESSLATIPIIASLFIPSGALIGLGTMALITSIGAASALSDSGSPASDSTLGPAMGLNVDGQHDHIRDTCIPNFLSYNILLMIFSITAAMVLQAQRGESMTHLLGTFEMSIDYQEDGLVVISMPVTDKVRQPFGYLYGGASVVLDETACSLGSANSADITEFVPLGLEMNANHIHSAKDGCVTVIAEIIHRGKPTHVRDIEIKNDKEQLITAMCGTVAIKPLE